MLEPRLRRTGEDERGRAAGLESDEASAADELVGTHAADENGVAEPAMLQGAAATSLDHVPAGMAAIEGCRHGHVGVDLYVIRRLGAEDDNPGQSTGRGLDQVGNPVNGDHDLLATGNRRVG